MEKYITAPISGDVADGLLAGDFVYISGTIYTARDAAHKRMYEALLEDKEIPFDLENNIIYYLGPSPARDGQVIGSAGPTTSSRMDKYTPLLLEKGLKGMIGKNINYSVQFIKRLLHGIYCVFKCILHGGKGLLLYNTPYTQISI